MRPTIWESVAAQLLVWGDNRCLFLFVFVCSTLLLVLAPPPLCFGLVLGLFCEGFGFILVRVPDIKWGILL